MFVRWVLFPRFSFSIYLMFVSPCDNVFCLLASSFPSSTSRFIPLGKHSNDFGNCQSEQVQRTSGHSAITSDFSCFLIKFFMYSCCVHPLVQWKRNMVERVKDQECEWNVKHEVVDGQAPWWQVRCNQSRELYIHSNLVKRIQ